MTLDPKQYRLTEAEHQALFEAKIKPTLFAGTISLDRPVAVIFGGQPGAGKSAAVASAENKLAAQGWSVLIEGIERAKRERRYEGRMPDLLLHERIIALRSDGRSIADTARLAGCGTTPVIFL